MEQQKNDIWALLGKAAGFGFWIVVFCVFTYAPKQWHRVHDQTFHMTGKVVDVNHESRSFVFSQYGGFGGLEEYYVDGDMPVSVGQCLDIDYHPKVLLGFFWTSDEHQIQIVHSNSSFHDGDCKE